MKAEDKQYLSQVGMCLADLFYNQKNIKMKQTAVEWLFEQIINRTDRMYFLKELKQAKQMEKEQIIDAYDEGQSNPYEYSEDNEVNWYDGNNYYNETFKSE